MTDPGPARLPPRQRLHTCLAVDSEPRPDIAPDAPVVAGGAHAEDVGDVCEGHAGVDQIACRYVV